MKISRYSYNIIMKRENLKRMLTLIFISFDYEILRYTSFYEEEIHIGNHVNHFLIDITL